MAFLQLRTVNNATKESNCYSWIGEDVVVAYYFNAFLHNFPAVTEEKHWRPQEDT
jgi:hypothetical protein